MKQERTSKRAWTKEVIQEEANKYPDRSKFASGNRSAYKKAQREEGLDENCGSMKSPLKPKGYWTKERIFEIAKTYKSRTDFLKNEPTAYRIALSHRWMKELNLFFEGKQPYTKEECRLEALKYNSKEEFMNGSPLYYNSAKKHRILTEICRHMGTNSNLRYVYVFEFEDHCAYIGLSCYPQRRCRQHLNDRSSTVFKHIKDTECKYIFKVLTDGLVEKAVQQEILWINKYKNDGWVLLNKELDELAGDGSPKYTYEYCEMIANRYAHSQNFRKGNALVYNYALRHGFLDNICKHMDKDTEIAQHWTKEKCQEEAKKYKTRKDFQKECRGAYAAAYRNKWLDDICVHMERPTPHNLYWTTERCAEEALKYTTRRDFQKSSPGAYKAAKKNGLLDNICVHMKRTSKPAGYWTEARCVREAKRYQSISDFRKNCPSAFIIAWRNGWIDEIRDFLK